MSLIYLCGQITGLSGHEARSGWRQKVYEALEDTDITCLSPMRHKTHLDHVKTLSEHGDPTSVVSTGKAITTRDRFDVMRADLLFCNLIGMDRVSLGSMIEFGWADASGVPILCCVEPGNPHDHAMFNELIGWRCSSLEEGIEVCKAILVPGL